MADDESVDFDQLCMQIEVSYKAEPYRLGEAMNLALAESAAATLDSGKKSKIVLEFELSRDKRDTLLIGAGMKIRVPEPSTLPIRVFADTKGRLTMSDPGQGKLRYLEGSDENPRRGGVA